MKYISNFSGGACSFWATQRAIDRHGRENVVTLFADTLEEAPDLYCFNQKAAQLLGIALIRISKEMTPWDLFRKEGLIGNDRFPICSTKLKREPLNEWMEAHYELEDGQGNAFFEDATVVLGFDWNELHRVAGFQAQHPTWRISAPMTEEPIWDKCKMIAECAALGFEIPLLYKLNFPHNNCGGGCVKAGISHFVHLLKWLPHKYARWEAEELNTQTEFKQRGIENWQYTILKDRRGNETKPLSLQELRLRVEAGEEFSKTEWGGCGCGGESEPLTHEQRVKTFAMLTGRGSAASLPLKSL